MRDGGRERVDIEISFASGVEKGEPLRPCEVLTFRGRES